MSVQGLYLRQVLKTNAQQLESSMFYGGSHVALVCCPVSQPYAIGIILLLLQPFLTSPLGLGIECVAVGQGFKSEVYLLSRLFSHTFG